jgi:indolepyruvate ferredoxin oxidoreductase
MFKLLAKFKRMRGTAFDPFGYMAERRMERRLVVDYRTLMEEVLETVDARNLATAIELAGAPQEVRGYGPVKHDAVEKYNAIKEDLLTAFRTQVPNTGDATSTGRTAFAL